jgi:hypothetical protein
MGNQLQTLAESNKKKTQEARKQALDAIDQLIAMRENVNFNSVHKLSGVSKSFLYADETARKLIEERRACEVDNEINRRAKYDKTSQSKDVIIAAKDRRIAKLEAQIRKLKTELDSLRGLVYAEK